MREEFAELFGRVLPIAVKARDVFRAGAEPLGNSHLDYGAITAIELEAHVLQMGGIFRVWRCIVRVSRCADNRFVGPTGIVLRAVVNHEHFRALHDCGRNASQHIGKSLRYVIGRNENEIIGIHLLVMSDLVGHLLFIYEN